MGVRSKSKSQKQRRRESLSVGDGDGNGNGGEDLISGLNNDLLVRILDLLPDARDAVRTHALSRRWRGLWTGVAALRFDSDSQPAVRRSARATKRYLAFVDDALAFRAKAKEPPVEDLKISFDISGHETEKLVAPSFQAAQRWIRYALEQEVKSLVLKLRLPWRAFTGIVMALDDLASSAKLETMRLKLGGAKLLPSSTTAVFASLTDLSLESMKFPAGGGGQFLSRLVSPACCPSLRKLCLVHLELSTCTMMEELLVDADALLELSLDNVDNMQSLELRTPSLRVLHVCDCLDLEGFKILAPRLEDLMFLAEPYLRIDDVHGHLSGVRTLKIELYSHGDFVDDDINDGTIHLLQHCRLTRCLELSLRVVERKYQTVDMIKGRIPPLPHVTSLTVHVTPLKLHCCGASIASFLAQCNNIRYLNLQLCYNITKEKPSEQDLLCDNACQLKSHEFSLAHLQEVEFNNLKGTDCEFQFIQSILTRETRIQMAAISFNPYYWPLKDNKDAFKLMSALDGGLWTMCNEAKLLYKWKRYGL